MTLANSIVVERCLTHVVVPAHVSGVFKCQCGTVVVTTLETALSHIEVSTLRHGVVDLCNVEHVLYRFLVVAVVEVDNSQHVGCGATRRGVAVDERDKFLKKWFCFRIVAHAVVAFTHNAVHLGGEVVVGLVFDERLAQGDGIAVVALLVHDLAHVVLRLVAQLTHAVHALE